MSNHPYEVGDKLLVLSAPSHSDDYVGRVIEVVLFLGEMWMTDNAIELENIDFAIENGYIFKLVEDVQPIATTPVVGNPKYNREIKPGTFVDVYDVLYAFKVTDPCLQHLIKKALAAGQRGHKDARQDLVDIRDSAQRALDSHDLWETQE